MAKLLNKKTYFIILVICAIAGGGYYYKAEAKGSDGEKSKNAQSQQKPMPVTVLSVTSEPIQIWKEFSAKLEAVNYAEIRPQVSGVVKDVKFKNGANVKKGDVLYIIDPKPYQAAVNQAQAEVRLAQNEVSLAKKELNRAKNLIEVDAISKRIFDERENGVKISKSRVESAKARLEQARINLNYASIKAPISGQVSRDEVKVGNLVEAGPNAPLLTTIVSTKNIYADFEVDEQTYLNEVRKVSLSTDKEQEKIPVKLLLNIDGISYDGYIQSFDNRLNPATGTIRARALFDNKDNVLLPGMFATIEMGTAVPQEKIVLTEKAISTDQDRKFVYVVNDENKVTYRPVKIGNSMNGKRVIKSGLSEGDKVIVEGIIRIRPDMIVDPQMQDNASIEMGNASENNLAVEAVVE